MLYKIPYKLTRNAYNQRTLLKKNLYDPSIGQESLTSIDVVGVLAGHILFGVAATFLIDWSWIPLSPQEKDRGRSLIDIKRSWGWEEKTDKQENYLNAENKQSLVEDDNK